MVEIGTMGSEMFRMGVGLFLLLIGLVLLFSMLFGFSDFNMLVALLSVLSFVLGSLLVGLSVRGRAV